MQRLGVLLSVLALASCVAPPTSWPDGEVPTRVPVVITSPRAQIVALHGFNDHKAAFDDLAEWLAPAGVLVRAYDQPGFGEAPGRGFWAGPDRLAAALHEQIADARARHPGVPVFVLGESMGAAVAVTALARADVPPFDGVILVSPAVWGGADFNPVFRATLQAAQAAMPGFMLSGGVGGIQASDNIDMLRRLGRDPAYILRTRVDALGGLVELMDEARAAAPDLGGRVLVMTGARDQVVAPRFQARFARTIGTLDCTQAVYPDGWHLLLRDLDRETPLRDLLAWLEGSDLPSGYGGTCVRRDTG